MEEAKMGDPKGLSSVRPCSASSSPHLSHQLKSALLALITTMPPPWKSTLTPLPTTSLPLPMRCRRGWRRWGWVSWTPSPLPPSSPLRQPSCTVSPMFVGGFLAKVTCYPKVLGEVFDPSLTFSTHAAALARKVRGRVKLLSAFTSSDWGKDKDCLVATYKAFINYGVTYQNLSSSSIRRLQLVQNR